MTAGAWEYQTLQQEVPPAQEELGILQDLGRAGWELVSVVAGTRASTEAGSGPVVSTTKPIAVLYLRRGVASTRRGSGRRGG